MHVRAFDDRAFDDVDATKLDVALGLLNPKVIIPVSKITT